MIHSAGGQKRLDLPRIPPGLRILRRLLRSVCPGGRICLVGVVLLAEVTLATVHRRCRCRLSVGLPVKVATAGIDAPESPVERGGVNLTSIHHRCREHVAGDLHPPQRLPVPQSETRQVVFPVAPAVGIDHMDTTVGNRRHAHQRVTQPPFPRRHALDGQHLQFAALGIERHEPLGHRRRGRSVVGRAVGPVVPTVGQAKGVELVAAETSADKHPPVNNRRRRQRAMARQLPTPPLAGGTRKCVGPLQPGASSRSLPPCLIHNATFLHPDRIPDFHPTTAAVKLVL